jgi:hypothetical protein
MLLQLLALPLTGPLRAVAWIGGVVRDAVDRQLNDPMEIKRLLAVLERQLEAGEISEQDYEAIEIDLIGRLRLASRGPQSGDRRGAGQD